MRTHIIQARPISHCMSRLSLFFFLILCNTCSLVSQTPRVVINEMMYTPQSGAPEWFELLNIDSQPINIKGWRMSDATSSRPIIIASDYIITANGFVVISKDSTMLVQFPEVAGSFIVANVPSLNNTGDDVAIYLPDTTLIEKISYLPSWGGSAGKSLERKNASTSGNMSNNWGTSIDVKGATPARKNSVAAVNYDLAIGSVRFTPIAPRIGEKVTGSIDVQNKGTQEAASYSVQCYDDLNKNDIPDAGELLFQRDATGALPAGQTTSYSGDIPVSQASTRQIITVIQFAQDENQANNKRNDILQYGVTQGSIVISEIMYAPGGGESEWVELFNTRTQSVSLKDWEIADNTTRVVITDADSTIPPNGYFVLSKSSAIRNYHARIPSSVIEINIPTFNNTGDEVRLFDARGFLIDSVRYAPEWGGATNGNSLERIDASANSNQQRNWSTSTDAERSTPGRMNSVGILDYDASVSAMNTVGNDVHVVVRNAGIQTLANLDVSLFYDANADSIATENEKLATKKTVTSLTKGDSTDVVFVAIDTISGTHTLIARVDAAGDGRVTNNSLLKTFTGGFQKSSFVINEIMFSPITDNAEYIEFINRTNREINMQDWKIADQPGTSGRNTLMISSAPIRVPAGAYLVVASDSSLYKQFGYLKTPATDRVVIPLNRSSLNLNSDIDDVVLIDPAGVTIDSVRYDARWHNPNLASTTGRSLERINSTFQINDSRNWSSSASKLGGTAGLRNSIYIDSPPNNIPGGNPSITFTPNPFSPDGDGFEDFTIMKWYLPSTVSQIRIRVYDTQGRVVRTVANNIPSGSDGELIWDGFDDEKRKLRIGMYVVLLEGMDINNNVVNAAKGVVVVASKL